MRLGHQHTPQYRTRDQHEGSRTLLGIVAEGNVGLRGCQLRITTMSRRTHLDGLEADTGADENHTRLLSYAHLQRYLAWGERLSRLLGTNLPGFFPS